MEMGNLSDLITVDDVAETYAMPKYDGFPWWVALTTEPLRERRAADWIKRLTGIEVFLPMFPRKIRCRGQRHRHVLYAVMPGLLFAPTSMWDVQRRHEVFEYAHVSGYLHHDDGVPRLIAKADIEIIREIEGKLNLPPAVRGVPDWVRVGVRVRFSDSSVASSWGTGAVFEVASDTRIGVEVPGLFGRTVKVFVPASEIEVM